jgi:hypothetical protein
MNSNLPHAGSELPTQDIEGSRLAATVPAERFRSSTDVTAGLFQFAGAKNSANLCH